MRLPTCYNMREVNGMTDDRILTVQQAAELLQLNYETTRRYVLKGIIPGRKLGGTWRIVESDLKRFISEGHALQLPREEV
jgi:excisionase family DNA binding protein